MTLLHHAREPAPPAEEHAPRASPGNPEGYDEWESHDVVRSGSGSATSSSSRLAEVTDVS